MSDTECAVCHHIIHTLKGAEAKLCTKTCWLILLFTAPQLTMPYRKRRSSGNPGTGCMFFLQLAPAGTFPSAKTIRTASGFRLGVPVCFPHRSNTSLPTRSFPTAERWRLYLNHIIGQALATGNVLAVLESSTTSQTDDGKWPDGGVKKTEFLIPCSLLRE